MPILIVEDEPRMLELLTQGLHEKGFEVMTASDGEQGLAIARAYDFDCIVLDIGLPKRDGYDLLHQLRTSNRHVPVLILTARDTEDEIIRGLDLGADDYLTKPFSFAELVLRLQAVMRATKTNGGVLELGDVVIDTLGHRASRSGRPLELSRQEFTLLYCLAQNAGLCVTRAEIIQSVWGEEQDVSAGTLDVLVNSLRSKIDASYEEKLITTVRGSGYVFECKTQTHGGAA